MVEQKDQKSDNDSMLHIHERFSNVYHHIYKGKVDMNSFNSKERGLRIRFAPSQVLF